MASYNTPKTILLKGSPMSKEKFSAGALRPGMLVRHSSASQINVHNNAAALLGPFMVVRELEFAGGGIDDLYETGDSCPYYIGRSGDEFYMLLAPGANVAYGAALQSNGAGLLTAQTSTNPTRAFALETVNNSGGSDPVRIKVEVA